MDIATTRSNRLSGLIWWKSFVTYETLQACASISGSKLYNFHLPYLVTFVNKLIVSFFPKCLGLPVLTKIFCKKCLFVSRGKPQFSLFYLQYLNIQIEGFPKSCRYRKYLSFASLITTITVLGAEQLAFPCYFLLSSAENVLSMSRNQNWSLLRQNNSKSIWQVSNKLDL